MSLLQSLSFFICMSASEPKTPASVTISQTLQGVGYSQSLYLVCLRCLISVKKHIVRVAGPFLSSVNSWLLSLFAGKQKKPKNVGKRLPNFPLSNHVWSLQSFIKGVGVGKLFYKFSWRNIDLLLLVHPMDLVKTCDDKYIQISPETSVKIS